MDEKRRQGAIKSFPDTDCVLVGACRFCAYLTRKWWHDSFHTAQCKMYADSFILLPNVINQPSVHVNGLIWDLNVLN